jgi:hypothetical protein
MTNRYDVYVELVTSDIQLDGVTLSVDYEFQEPEEGEKEPGTGLLLTPDLPPTFVVECVFHESYDITDLLSEDTFDRIHQVLLERYQHSSLPSYNDYVRGEEEDL